MFTQRCLDRGLGFRTWDSGFRVKGLNSLKGSI